MNRHIIATIYFFTICFNYLIAQNFTQDTILLLNSERVYGKVTDTTKSLIKFQYKNKKQKLFESAIEKERVFAIYYATGTESLIYLPDSSNEEEFSTNDMRYFIKGQHDAALNFNSKKSFYGGIGMGLLGSITPFVILSPVIPGVYSFVNGSRWMKIKKMKNASPEDVKKDTYLMGYTRVARNKRIQSSLKGSAIGLVAGLTTMYILSQNKIYLFD